MDYSILRYGAVADGVTNCAAAIQQAVDAAAAAGGGRVIVPAGRFLSGSVLLKDNVELHLESGAVLISSLNPADITPFPQGGDGTDPDDTADGWEGGFFLGASSFTSAPMMFALVTVRMAPSSCKKLTPPASGVPVPGNADGSRQSRSIVR